MVRPRGEIETNEPRVHVCCQSLGCVPLSLSLCPYDPLFAASFFIISFQDENVCELTRARQRLFCATRTILFFLMNG